MNHVHYYLCRQLKGGGMEIFMEFIKTSEFSEMTYGELAVVDGGFVITIGALTITSAALAKGAAIIGGAYMAGYTLGDHVKKAQGR